MYYEFPRPSPRIFLLNSPSSDLSQLSCGPTRSLLLTPAQSVSPRLQRHRFLVVLVSQVRKGRRAPHASLVSSRKRRTYRCPRLKHYARAPLLQPRSRHGACYLPRLEAPTNTKICQKLVELISALQTSEDTLERARAFAVACGKGTLLSSTRRICQSCSSCHLLVEVTVSKDVPGFVSNALLMPFINEVSRHPPMT